MVKPEKVEEVASLKKSFEKSSLAVCVDFRGVKVDQISRLRKQLRTFPVEYKVVKNTLTRLAVQNTPFQPLEQFLSGPTGVAFFQGDPVTPIKVLTKFAKDVPNFQIKGGVIDGVPIGPQEIEKLAELPSREVLLAQLLAVMKSPITNLVWTLQGILRQLIYTLQAIADKKANA
jgi:large subunit ribosomal protein L10